MAINSTIHSASGPLPVASPERYRQSRRGEIAIWWREIDRTLLALILILMAIGTAAVAAGSPASARRLSTATEQLDDLYFFTAHVRWQIIGLIVLFTASALSKDTARRIAIMVAGVMIFALMLVPVFGSEVNGARRWLDLGIRIQPSEFLKAPFAVTMAWILSWRVRDPHLPVIAITAGLMGFVAILIMLQPNLGSVILLSAVWFALVLLAGLPVRRIVTLGCAALGGLVVVYLTYPNGRNRINDFISGGTEFDQVDLAQRTLLNGGWTGTGFWLGQRKMALPEAHTDYIFSVIGEEFGLLACAVIILLYLAIVIRVLMRLVDEEDLFTVLAGAGLVTQFGGQAFINILVNLQLFPSKGMTLPLISYGGSSTIALCFGVGLLIAITRRNPYIQRERISLRDIGGTA